MAFQDIPGNDRIKKILKLALSRRRVPHSLLFAGPEGVGKKRLAVELAKALICLERTDDACGTCPNCVAVAEGALPDVLEIVPAKSVITIDQIRDLKEIAYSRPMTARVRVFIIDPADRMQDAAANAFLKVLEEPPLSTHFLLVSSRPELLLPTIRSRCQTLAFRPVADEDVRAVLLAAGMEEDKARILTLFVRGNLERAREMDWDEVQEKRFRLLPPERGPGRAPRNARALRFVRPRRSSSRRGGGGRPIVQPGLRDRDPRLPFLARAGAGRPDDRSDRGGRGRLGAQLQRRPSRFVALFPNDRIIPCPNWCA
jgi:DNA polymerase III delta' subunit